VPRPLSALLPSARPALSISILAADLLRLDRELARIESAGATFVHVDIMDGHVTPTLSVGPRFVSALRTPLLTDVHLLVARPESVLTELAAVGADIVTVQLETVERPLDTLRGIDRVPGRRAPDQRAFRGVAIGPQIAADAITPLLPEIELVVVLGVELLTLKPLDAKDVVHKLERVRELVAGFGILVAIDGGVTLANVEQLAGAQPDIVVAGSAVFSGVFEEQVSALQRQATAGMPAA
jgi:ribulose-phosphate 3-epimerase